MFDLTFFFVVGKRRGKVLWMGPMVRRITTMLHGVRGQNLSFSKIVDFEVFMWPCMHSVCSELMQ